MRNIRNIQKTLILIIILVASVSISVVSFAALVEKEITADGMAAGSSLKAKDMALNRALRNAVEQGVGVFVDSETVVENFQVLDDNIYSEAKGYVKEYEVVSDNEGAGGIYRIKIKAKVALGALSKDVQGLGIIREKMNYPRVVVIIDDYIDGMEQPGKVAAGEIEKVFMQEKFPIVNKDQLEKIKQKDATVTYFDPLTAAALGRRYGAEVAIVGQASSNLVESSKPYGVSVFAYGGRVEVRAVKVDNAEVIVFDVAEAVERGSGRVATANKAIKAASDKLSESLMKRITEAWRDEVYNEMSILVICNNADMRKAKAFKESLSDMRDVQGVNERSLSGGVLELDVRFFGNSEQLAALISDKGDPSLEITGKTPNRIDIKFD